MLLGSGPATSRSGRLAAEAVTALIREGTRAGRVRAADRGALRSRRDRLASPEAREFPDAVARVGVRVVLGSEAARRRIVFDSIFGMREVAP